MKILTIIIIVAALIVASLSMFIVSEPEYAIRFRLGKIVQTEYPPGLHFKVPFINNVRKYDRRILTLDAEPERFLTSEKKDVIVDSFMKWRISDPAQYHVATQGDQARARNRLSQIIRDGLRREFSKRTLQEVVSGERTDIMEAMTGEANQIADRLGVEIVDVRIKRIDLPSEVEGSVFERMRAERARVANQLRSQGREQSERIRADADRQSQVIVARAQKEGDQIRGAGDARSAAIYADAYERDREFYAFWRSLEAYEKAFGSSEDMMVLDPQSEFFDYFRNQGGNLPPRGPAGNRQ